MLLLSQAKQMAYKNYSEECWKMKQFENFVLTNIGKTNIMAITFNEKEEAANFLDQTKESCFVVYRSDTKYMVVPDEFYDDCEDSYLHVIDPDIFTDAVRNNNRR
jgi:hypothetical protein